MTTGENQPRPARSGGGGGRGGGFRRSHPKACPYCVDKALRIDYKIISDIRMALNEHGKIKSRRVSGICAAHQRRVAAAIKRARNMALLPFVTR